MQQQPRPLMHPVKSSNSVSNRPKPTDLTSLENSETRKNEKNLEKSVENLLDSKSGVSEDLKEELISVSQSKPHVLLILQYMLNISLPFWCPFFITQCLFCTCRFLQKGQMESGQIVYHLNTRFGKLILNRNIFLPAEFTAFQPWLEL